MRRRSFSVVPPHTPSSPVCRACSLHSLRTGQIPHICLASCSRSGSKNIACEVSLHAAIRRHGSRVTARRRRWSLYHLGRYLYGWSLALCSWPCALCSWRLALGAWRLVLGAWRLVPCALCLVRFARGPSKEATHCLVHNLLGYAEALGVSHRPLLPNPRAPRSDGGSSRLSIHSHPSLNSGIGMICASRSSFPTTMSSPARFCTPTKIGPR